MHLYVCTTNLGGRLGNSPVTITLLKQKFRAAKKWSPTLAKVFNGGDVSHSGMQGLLDCHDS